MYGAACPESGFLAYKLPSMSDRLQATDKPEAYVAMEATR